MGQDIRLSREQRALAIGRLSATARMQQNAVSQLEEVTAEFFGLNTTDMRCFDMIEHLGPLTAGKLAEESGLTTGAVTTVVDRLEAAGYAHRVRSSVDRRKVLITLTTEARGLAQEVYGPYKYRWVEATDSLTDADLLSIIEYLETAQRIDLEHAALIRERFLGRRATLRQRLDEARKLRDDAKALAKRLKQDVKDRTAAIRRLSEGLDGGEWEKWAWSYEWDDDAWNSDG